MKRNNTTNPTYRPTLHLPHNTYPLSSLIYVQHAFSFQLLLLPWLLIESEIQIEPCTSYSQFWKHCILEPTAYIEHDNTEPYVHTIVTVKVSNKQKHFKKWQIKLLHELQFELETRVSTRIRLLHYFYYYEGVVI